MKHTNKVHGHKRVLMVVEKRHLIIRVEITWEKDIEDIQQQQPGRKASYFVLEQKHSSQIWISKPVGNIGTAGIQ